MPKSKNPTEHILMRMERLANIGHWRWDVNTNELYWSQGVYDIHGLDFDDYKPSFDAALDAYLPEDRDEIEKILTHAIENKEDFQFEKRIKRPSGEIRHVISQGECDFDEKTGELIALFGVFQDITPIKQQEQLYELSALASNAALWEWDITEDKLRWAGRSAKVLGYTSKNQLPKSTHSFFNNYIHEDDQSLIIESFVNHFTTSDKFNIELRVKDNDGNYLWFLARAQAEFDNYGKAIRACGSLTSIQKLKEIQAKLERSNDDLEHYASTAAHEIKTPIRSIATYLELIRMEQGDLSPKLQDYFDKTLDISNNAGRMVDELLTYALLQDAKLSLKSVNLDRITKLIIRSMKDEVKACNAEITCGNLPSIQADSQKIMILITNLIQNALKYKSDAPPVITINTEEKDDHWEYSITDNGIGIPEDEAHKIFNKFERLSNIGEVSGTGIGLSICQRIIDLHGGKIWATPYKDQGTTFTFTIPKDLK